MKTIFLVTAGSYSDFHVVAAYSEREAADRAVADGLGEDIEELNLDQEREMPPPGMKAWWVSMARDGSAASAHQAHPYEQLDGKHVLKWPSTVTCEGGGVRCRFQCWARDEEHAIKIVNEKRIQMIVNGHWLEHKEQARTIAGTIVTITVADIINDGFGSKWPLS